MIFSVYHKKIRVLGILGSPYRGIVATIRLGQEMLCLPYAGLFIPISAHNFGQNLSSLILTAQTNSLLEGLHNLRVYRVKTIYLRKKSVPHSMYYLGIISQAFVCFCFPR